MVMLMMAMTIVITMMQNVNTPAAKTMQRKLQKELCTQACVKCKGIRLMAAHSDVSMHKLL
eukprot:12408688-Karenia_brevis.AAC.1